MSGLSEQDRVFFQREGREGKGLLPSWPRLSGGVAAEVLRGVSGVVALLRAVHHRGPHGGGGAADLLRGLLLLPCGRLLLLLLPCGRLLLLLLWGLPCGLLGLLARRPRASCSRGAVLHQQREPRKGEVAVEVTLEVLPQRREPREHRRPFRSTKKAKVRKEPESQWQAHANTAVSKPLPHPRLRRRRMKTHEANAHRRERALIHPTHPTHSHSHTKASKHSVHHRTPHIHHLRHRRVHLLKHRVEVHSLGWGAPEKAGRERDGSVRAA